MIFQRRKGDDDRSDEARAQNADPENFAVYLVRQSLLCRKRARAALEIHPDKQNEQKRDLKKYRAQIKHQKVFYAIFV